MIIPIFTSHYSIGKSILTLSNDLEIKNNYPVSIFAIAKKYSLNEIFLLETNCSGFVEAYKSSEFAKIPFRFGLQLIVCSDIDQKTEDSLLTESKINIWALNNNGYKRLMQIYSKAATEGFYYIPRIDWSNLNQMLNSDLVVNFPFYDNFLHNNLFKRHSCILNLNTDYSFLIEENNDLPVDILLKEEIEKYCKINSIKIFKFQTCYYYAYEDALAYQTFRCRTSQSKKTSLTEPELNGFGSSNFCFENYCKHVNIDFLKYAK